MYRLALLSTIFAAAASAQDLRAAARDMQRRMQGLNLDAFQFNFAGININADLAQEECPDEWTPVITCVISDCPEFMEVCPDFNVPVENQGTVPPAPAPADLPATTARQANMTEMIDGAVDMVENMTLPPYDNITIPPIVDEIVDELGNLTIPPIIDETVDELGNITIPPLPTDGTIMPTSEMTTIADMVPDCDEIKTSFCEAFGTEIDNCCLLDCTAQIQKLLVCVVLKTTGEDRSDCEVPQCESSAATSTTAPTKEPSTSSASVPRVTAGVAASMIAFAML